MRISGHRVGFLLLVSVWLATLSLPLRAGPEDRAALLQGVTEVAAPGSPGGLSTLGPDAFPVVSAPLEGAVAAPMIAGTRLGTGRILAFGHDGFFGTAAIKTGQTGQFLQNAVRWLTPAGKVPNVAVMGADELAAYLSGAGVRAAAVPATRIPNGVTVVALTHGSLTGDLPDRLATWVRGGGGLMIASTGWGWSQITEKPITMHPGSLLTAPAGLIWNSALLSPVNGVVAVQAYQSPMLHAGNALAALSRSRRGAADPKQALQSCLLAAGSLPANETAFRARLANSGTPPVPTAAKPVDQNNPRAALDLAVSVTMAQEAPVAQVRAHPAAADFPGSVPADATSARRTVSIDPAEPGWASTGLYAPAGKPITVTLPFNRLKGSWSVRIGAHTDELWALDSWQRAPSITRAFPVTQRVTTVASAFGGPVYVVVPEQAGTGAVAAQIEGAVDAPYFRVGKTSLQEWRRTIRRYPAPWAELSGRRVVFTVPSEAVRELRDPQALMELWDSIVAGEEKLVASPARPQLERIVADRQISAGYMHSGYPVMTPIDDSMRDALNETKLRAQGTWGHLHELGHNLQHEDWTFDGTGEVTNNVMVLYAFEKVLGLPFDSGISDTRDKAARSAKVKRYVAGGSQFAKWKEDPFLALTMYIEVIDQFGWGPLEKVFAEYRALPDAQRPKNDDQKRDQWLVRLSRATGRNLSPFFQRWGVPVSNAAKGQVRSLPAWSGPA